VQDLLQGVGRGHRHPVVAQGGAKQAERGSQPLTRRPPI
jgi:hypothetical protein